MTVRILNPAHVPDRDLAAAERIASAIFRNAGVAIQWVDCPEAEPGVWLHLLENPRASLPGDALGFAVLTHQSHNEGGYAAISWRNIRRLSDSVQVDRAPLLGIAIAHELGHVLLDSNAHSHNGVMVARLGLPQLNMAARGELLFNEAQAATIRSAAGLLARRF